MARDDSFAKILAGGFVALGVWLGAVGPAEAGAAGDPTGWWLDQSQRAGILIAPCGALLCGRIEWLRHPLTDAGQPKTDLHNGDSGLRARKLCGLPMIGGFAPDGPGTWSGGWIYNPDDGDTYKSTMRLDADGTLHVRGYIFIPLIGKSQIWTRPAAALPVCH